MHALSYYHLDSQIEVPELELVLAFQGFTCLGKNLPREMARVPPCLVV